MSDFVNDDELLIDLISFVRDKTGTYNVFIDENTTMEDGLGVTGDDGAELIADFSVRYGVDISSFKFAKYFNDEPGLFMRERAITPLTIKNLLDAIKSGYLE